MKILLLLFPFLLFAESQIHFVGVENGLSKHKIICDNGNEAVVLINEKTRDTYLLQDETKVYYGKNALMKIEHNICK